MANKSTHLTLGEVHRRKHRRNSDFLYIFAKLWKTSCHVTNWQLVHVREFRIGRIRGKRTEVAILKTQERIRE